jgi:hypothetical protein
VIAEIPPRERKVCEKGSVIAEIPPYERKIHEKAP